MKIKIIIIIKEFFDSSLTVGGERGEMRCRGTPGRRETLKIIFCIENMRDMVY